MIKGQCHCGKIKYEYRDTPPYANRCNCSICRRLGALWIYSDASNITIEGLSDSTSISYSHSDMELDFRTCNTCGTTILWQRRATPSEGRMAVNLNMADLDVVNSIRIRHFDGADTWTHLD